MNRTRDDRATRDNGPAAGAGFTLIELLIVISILGVLAAVLVPAILEGDSAAKQTATEATFSQLELACKNFNRAHGVYPSDDLTPAPGQKVDWKPDNGRNTGIESLLVMISQSKRDGTELSGLRDRLVNTDGDLHGVPLPLLDGQQSRFELADAWGTPLVYFNGRNMDKPQMVVPGEGEAPVQVKARRRADGSYYGGKKWQLLSAGEDLTFGTEDDLVWPK